MTSNLEFRQSKPLNGENFFYITEKGLLKSVNLELSEKVSTIVCIHQTFI